MNEIIPTEIVEAKTEVSLEDRLKTVVTELDSIKAQIKQVEEQMIKNQKQLQAAKDQLMTRGVELQGQEKLLRELTGKVA